MCTLRPAVRRIGSTGAGRLLLLALAALIAAAVIVVAVDTTHDSAATQTTPAGSVTLTRTTALAPGHLPAVTVGAPLNVRPVASGFLGFSFEYYVIGSYVGNPAAPDPLFLQLVRNLNEHQAPNLRIGGDSTDWAYLPTPGVKKVKGFKVALTPAVIAAIAAVQKALGARLELGIDFEAGSTALARHMASALLAAIPSASVRALEVGNEPELYDALGWYANAAGEPVFGRARGYTLADYTRQFNIFARVLPQLPLAGAASGSPRWDAGVATFVKDAARLGMVTVHGYPMKVCGTHPGEADYPSIANLLAPSSTIGLVQSLIPALEAAHAAGKPIRVDETNSVSCFGKAGVSNTFAAALWSIESAFEFARAGFAGLNYTTLPAAAYRLWTFDAAGATVAPEYYGLLAFADAVPPGSKILATPNSGTNPQVFAAKTPSGQTHVVVVNPGAARRLALRVPAGGGHEATATTLSAASLTATAGVTLAGQSFGAPTATGDQTTSGELSGSATGIAVTPVDGAYVLALPAHSATTLSVG